MDAAKASGFYELFFMIENEIEEQPFYLSIYMVTGLLFRSFIYNTPFTANVKIKHVVCYKGDLFFRFNQIIYKGELL